MCTSKGPSKPKPAPVQAPVAPPMNTQAKVETGNQSETESKRKKIGRSQLRQASSGGQSKSGLGG